MKLNDPQALSGKLPPIEISSATSEAEAMTAVQIFDQFEDLMVGVVHFSGLTPWECHTQDELLYVLGGAVEVTLWREHGPEEVVVSAGSMCVVPKGVWHRQLPKPTVRLMFITGDTEVSKDETPPLKSG